MKQLTRLLPLGFDASLSHRMMEGLKVEKYLIETWHQIIKDFQLAGIPLDGLKTPKNLDELHRNVLVAIPGEDRGYERRSLLYRVDLPGKAKNAINSEAELALALVIREFQKVWLREHLSGDRPVDGPSKTG